MNLEILKIIIFIIVICIFARFLIKYASVNSDYYIEKNRKKHDVKAGVLEKIAAQYGFTYKKQGIYHFYTLKQFKINFDPFSYDNKKYKSKGKNRYIIPYSTTYDYLSGIYKGIEMTGSSVRFNMPYDSDGDPGYVYREEKPYEEWVDTDCFFCYADI